MACMRPMAGERTWGPIMFFAMVFLYAWLGGVEEDLLFYNQV